MNIEVANYSTIAYKASGKFEETRFEKIHNVSFNSSSLTQIQEKIC